jgi:hypothetical protein
MNADEPPPLSLREIASGIFAAAIGVRSTRGRERDFTRGTARAWVIAGLIATVLFVLAVYGAVKLILWLALAP